MVTIATGGPGRGSTRSEYVTLPGGWTLSPARSPRDVRAFEGGQAPPGPPQQAPAAAALGGGLLLSHPPKPSVPLDVLRLGAKCVTTLGNGQRLWEALATACAGHELVIVDMTATKSCGLETLTALIMVLRYIDSGGT